MIKKAKKNGNLYIILAFVMMGILFISSSQTYEQQSQIGLLGKLLKNEPFKDLLSGWQITYGGSVISIEKSGYLHFVEFFLRKGAHFGSYFILGSMWFLGLQIKMKATFLPGVVSWLAATGYAGLDEFHQMLTGGRTPMFEDLMLDSIGAMTGIVLCLLFSLIRQMRKKR